jgi:hypothetical protein
VTEVVLDASVIVKWAFPDRAREAHAERAVNLLHAVHAGRLSVVEPHTGWPRWRPWSRASPLTALPTSWR